MCVEDREQERNRNCKFA